MVYLKQISLNGLHINGAYLCYMSFKLDMNVYLDLVIVVAEDVPGF